jgi:hypothetical protein
LDEQQKEQPGQAESASARLQQRLKEFEAKFREGVKDLEKTVRSEFHDAIPPEVSEHLKKSKQEFLLAVRGIVDRQIERSRKQPTKSDGE